MSENLKDRIMFLLIITAIMLFLYLIFKISPGPTP